MSELQDTQQLGKRGEAFFFAQAVLFILVLIPPFTLKVCTDSLAQCIVAVRVLWRYRRQQHDLLVRLHVGGCSSCFSSSRHVQLFSVTLLRPSSMHGTDVTSCTSQGVADLLGTLLITGGFVFA